MHLQTFVLDLNLCLNYNPRLILGQPMLSIIFLVQGKLSLATFSMLYSSKK